MVVLAAEFQKREQRQANPRGVLAQSARCHAHRIALVVASLGLGGRETAPTCGWADPKVTKAHCKEAWVQFCKQICFQKCLAWLAPRVRGKGQSCCETQKGKGRRSHKAQNRSLQSLLCTVVRNESLQTGDFSSLFHCSLGRQHKALRGLAYCLHLHGQAPAGFPRLLPIFPNCADPLTVLWAGSLQLPPAPHGPGPPTSVPGTSV